MTIDRRHPGKLALLVIASLMIAGTSSSSAQTIVLRDLTLIESTKVASLDESQLSLADGRSFSWDEILQANVAERFQEQVDENIEQIGQPTFRLKNRILAGDVALAAGAARSLLDAPDPQIRFLANRAMMRFLVQSGNNESAVVCMFRAMLAQKEFARDIDPGMQHLLFEDGSFSSIVGELLPVFSNSQAASDAITEIGDLENDRVLVNKLPVAAVYMRLLGAVAGKTIRNLPIPATLSRWQTLNPLAAGRNVQQTLEQIVAPGDEMFRVTAMFYWSTSPKSGGVEKRILGLLRIAAAWREKYPNIARLSLRQAATVAKGTQFEDDLNKVAFETDIGIDDRGIDGE